MNLRALPLSSSQKCYSTSIPLYSSNISNLRTNITDNTFRGVWIRAEKKKQQKNGEKEEEEEGGKKKSKQSLFGSITEALDFSQVRSSQDAQLLDEAREATSSGGKMNREQYGALRRKIGGTYKDFFKSYVDDGDCDAHWKYSLMTQRMFLNQT